ncbi:DsbA family protein [Bartonella taylorii]|uniref:DsbA family protein n=1 Tax=Bartonella taylorii TaxID=33046 RepID=A0A9Q9DMR4_BARTA|nr:DsbA family protein [Bartonella taylorii]OPB34884.1 Protein-disulfide isomerase [Bartonella taylorii]USP03161.1 DsbA family protein [Bartonella taylorii]
MTHKPQSSKITFIAKLSATIILSILICSSSSNATSSEKTASYVNAESLKTQLLEDPNFLSKLKEKITPRIDDHDIRKIIRDYLLTHPEIMIEMQLSLEEKLEKKSEQKAKKQASIINLLKKEIFQSPHDAFLGNPNGKKVLVDFFDYNCGYCKISYSYIENLIKEHPDLRVIIKDLPILGTDSMAAHTVAYVFRKQFPEKYPQFHKALLTSKSRVNEAKAIKIAVSLGADEKKLRNAIRDPDLQNSFKENIQIASTLNITGTPSYIIADKVFIGAVDQNILKEAIENIQ